MKLLFTLLALCGLVGCATAVSPSFQTFDTNSMIVDQPHNFIGTRSGVTNDPFGSTANIMYVFRSGTNVFVLVGVLTNGTTGGAQFATNAPDGVSLNSFPTNTIFTNTGPNFVLNRVQFLNTNSFGGGGGSGTLTNVVYTNAGPSWIVIGQTSFLNTNTFGGSGGGGVTSFTTTNGASIVIGSLGFIKTNYVVSGSGGGGVSVASSAVAGGINLGINVSGGLIGDVTGFGTVNSISTTVVKINGTSLAGLGTGILKNTTGTGVPSIAVLGIDYGSLTNVVYTNTGPPWLVINATAYLNTNSFGGGGGGGGITALTGDVTASGSGSVAATVKGINGTIMGSLLSGVVLNTFITGAPTTVADWPSLASHLTSLIPQSALGTGSGGAGTKFLADDQTYKTPGGGGGGISALAPTNAQVPSVVGSTGYTPTGFISNSLFNVQSVQKSVTFGGFEQTNWFVEESNFGATLAGVAADFNLDGKMDFLVTKDDTGINVFTNSGIMFSSLNFVSAKNFNAAGVPTGIAIADVNGDGRPDVIVLSSTAVRVFTNFANGPGSISFAQEGSDYSMTSGYGLYSADFNGDGKPDFIASSSSGAAVEYTNDGTGIFVQDTATTFPAYAHSSFNGAIGHFMGTTNYDLVLPNGSVPGVLLLTNDGLGDFTVSSTQLLTLHNGSMATNDFNNDGLPDVVVFNPTDGQIWVVTNTGLGSFSSYSTNAVPPSGVNYAPATGDFTMDGLADIIAPNDAAGYVILTNSGAGLGFGIFATNVPLASQVCPFVADFNGDGRPDIAWYGISGPDLVIVESYNLPAILAVVGGDGSGLTAVQVTVKYKSTAVTPALAWAPGIPEGGTAGTLTIATNYLKYSTANAHFILGTIMTQDTSAAPTFNGSGNSEHIYNDSASTQVSVTITLSTSSVPGQVNRYSTHGICTSVTVSGTVTVGAAVTALAADSSVAWQAIDASTWVRIQ